METLNDVRHYLSIIPDIHYGGCGIAAYAMYKWMVTNNCVPKDFRIVFGTNCEEQHQNNRRAMSDKSVLPTAPSHIFLRVNKKHLDAMDDVVSLTRYYFLQYIKEKDVWFLLESINNKRTWNRDFNRRRQVPRIAKHLGISLSEIVV